jgi:hypothetical protein
VGPDVGPRISLEIMRTAAEPSGPGGARRAALFRHPGRVAIVLGVLLIVVNLAVVALVVADTSDEGQQAVTRDVEQVSPRSGSIASPQDDVEVRLRGGLTGVLVIDDARIPEDQLEIDNATSRITYRPGPDQDIETFEAGTHFVTVLYWEQTKPEPRNPERFTWNFRVAA